MRLEDFRDGIKVDGLVAGTSVTIETAHTMGDILKVVYSTADNTSGIVMVNDDLAAKCTLADPARNRIAFDADPEEFRLAAEALRIKNASAYDPMVGVYSSNIDPLPHQIRAVYEDLLPKIPLRFLLADDPGAGKTVMAGLYIKEMLLRHAASRIIVVCPGGLAEQWRDELRDKFDLDFDIYTPDLDDVRNPFEMADRLIVRMDQVAREESRRDLLSRVSWDIAVVDEAHRMSAHFKSSEDDIKKTNRFRVGEILADTAENLLLMTATPHSGKEEDFQLFMSLLDRDRFAGRFRDKTAYHADVRDLMRRTVKENMLTFDGRRLFTERTVETISYSLTAEEMNLYQNITEYVRTGMRAADRLPDSERRRAGNIGFALTMLQRRLASSPAAILRSLERRRARLQQRLEELDSTPAEAVVRDKEYDALQLTFDKFDDMWDDNDESEQLRLDFAMDEIIESTTAANTRVELTAEISQLDSLVAQAYKVYQSGIDTKWCELGTVLSRNILEQTQDGFPHKLIVFTEHKDTVHYLQERIASLLGKEEAVCVIHGGMNRTQRKTVCERFVQDPAVRILVATDAAGEGLNLQRADFMVNYDLPWNPNRIEQRFGRIHRIGQQRPCFLWNMVATDTREGDVYHALLTKIDTIDKAYQGRLFNVLGSGKLFNNKSLEDLMIDAIRYGEREDVRRKLDEIVDSGVSAGLQELVNEKALYEDLGSSLDIQHVRSIMEEHRERKLQPGYVAAFVNAAVAALGGRMISREHGRWELRRVPFDVVREGKRRDPLHPIMSHYERITFDSRTVHVPNAPDALLITPGGTFLEALIEVVLSKYGEALTRGTVFVDRTGEQEEMPKLLVSAEQRIVSAGNETFSNQFDYVQIGKDGNPSISSAPPYLNYDGITAQERESICAMMREPWVQQDFEQELQGFIFQHITQGRLQSLQAEADKRATHAYEQSKKRLQAEAEYWYGAYNERQERERQGLGRRSHPASSAKRRAQQMEYRLEECERYYGGNHALMAQPAMLRGMALVIPSRLIDRGKPSRSFARNTEEVDRRAVALAMKTERALGRNPTEMPHNNQGYDIQSVDGDGRTFFIEVKGRIDTEEADTFTVTANEVAFAQSQGDRHRLALVRVSPKGPASDEIRYVDHAFDHIRPSASTRSYNERWNEYWSRCVDSPSVVRQFVSSDVLH